MNNTGDISIKNRILNTLTYLPFIGWIITILFSSKDETLKFHVAQGYKLTIFTIFLVIFIYFAGLVIPNTYKSVLLGFVIAHNVLIIIYLALSAFMMISVFLGKNFKLPLISRSAAKVNI